MRNVIPDETLVVSRISEAEQRHRLAGTARAHRRRVDAIPLPIRLETLILHHRTLVRCLMRGRDATGRLRADIQVLEG